MIENFAAFVPTTIQKISMFYFYELESCVPSHFLFRTPNSLSFFVEMSFLIEFGVEFARFVDEISDLIGIIPVLISFHCIETSNR